MRLWVACWMSERNGDSGGRYESHLQGFVGGDTTVNIVLHMSIGFSFTKLQVGRDVIGGLSSKSKKW